MILAPLSEMPQYFALHSQLKSLFDYLSRHDLSVVPAGRVELDGERLFINVSDVQLKTKEEQNIEVHRAYIDVHIPLSGDEIIGWKSLKNIGKKVPISSDETADFSLFDEPADEYFTVHPGQFFICFPDDGHAPVIGEGKLRKLIVKIKI